MGFTVYYQSTAPVSDNVVSAIADSLDELCVGRTWLSCEPVGFFGGNNEDFLIGGSKPNFDPRPEDIADARAEGLPDGTLRDVVQILCKLSSQFGVDWQFSHDHDPGPIGFIRDGIPDAELENQIVGIMSLHSIEGSSHEYDTGNESTNADNGSDDDDDGPRILKFGPIDH